MLYCEWHFVLCREQPQASEVPEQLAPSHVPASEDLMRWAEPEESLESDSDELELDLEQSARAAGAVLKRARKFMGKRARKFMGKRARKFMGKRARKFMG